MRNYPTSTLVQICLDHGVPGFYRICDEGFLYRFDHDPILSEDGTFWKAHTGTLSYIAQLQNYNEHQATWKFIIT